MTDIYDDGDDDDDDDDGDDDDDDCVENAWLTGAPIIMVES